MEKNQNSLFNSEGVETVKAEKTESTNSEGVETIKAEETESTNSEEVETVKAEETETVKAEETKLTNTSTTNQQDLFGLLGLEKKPSKKETSKTKTKIKTNTNTTNNKEEFKGTRIVKVYGTELFREENSSVTLEQLRQRVEEEFGFPEFTKDLTVMTLDKNTGIVVPVRKFGSKG